MKEKLKNVIKIAAMALFITTAIFSCKKKETDSPKNELNNNIDVETLKSHMSKIINVKVSDIKYDEKTEQFSIFGIDQIDRKKLTEFYEQSKKQ